MRYFAVFALAGLIAACGDSSSDDDGDGDGMAGAGGGMPVSCMPGTERECPCIGGEASGTQLCNPDAVSYAACLGCPEPQPAADAGPVTDAAQGADAAAAVDAGAPDAAVGDGGAVVPMPKDGEVDLAPELGPLCGVGLPSVCAMGSEMCCVRSLDTDTCVADAPGACDCMYSGCNVLTVRCDGPEDCSDGEVCCGTLSGGLRYSEFECATGCDHTGSQRIACHVGGDDTCPSDTVCAHSQILTNIQVCIDPSSIQQ